MKHKIPSPPHHPAAFTLTAAPRAIIPVFLSDRELDAWFERQDIDRLEKLIPIFQAIARTQREQCIGWN